MERNFYVDVGQVIFTAENSHLFLKEVFKRYLSVTMI